MKTRIGMFALAAGLVAAVIGFWSALASWQQMFFGFRNGDGNGSHYLFFSGWGSILLPPILTVAGIAALAWWHSQCQVSGCYWPARRHTAANEKVCWRHAPHQHRTFEQICEAHHLYLGRQPGKG